MRGFCVPLYSIEEMEERFDIRSVLERYALRCVCETITVKDFDHIGGFIQKAEVALKQKKIDAKDSWANIFRNQKKMLCKQLMMKTKPFELLYR